MSFADRVFTEWPRRVALEEYEGALGRSLEHLRRFRSVRAVYQIGAMNDTLFSDIDLVIVVDGAHEVLKKEGRRLAPPGIFRAPFFLHRPVILTAPLFRAVRLIVFDPAPRLLWGDAIAYPDYPADLDRTVKLTFLVDGLGLRLLMYAYALSEAKLGIRSSVVHLSSLGHSVNLFTELFPQSEICVPLRLFSGEISAFRTEWPGAGEGAGRRVSELLDRAAAWCVRIFSLLGALPPFVGLSAGGEARACTVSLSTFALFADCLVDAFSAGTGYLEATSALTSALQAFPDFRRPFILLYPSFLSRYVDAFRFWGSAFTGEDDLELGFQRLAADFDDIFRFRWLLNRSHALLASTFHLASSGLFPFMHFLDSLPAVRPYRRAMNLLGKRDRVRLEETARRLCGVRSKEGRYRW